MEPFSLCKVVALCRELAALGPDAERSSLLLVGCIYLTEYKLFDYYGNKNIFLEDVLHG